MEQCGEPIRIYLPYIAETKDQKMYQVVTDRERWFNVVMGHKFLTDVRTTEAMTTRIPPPDSAAAPLAMRLEVVPVGRGMPDAPMLAERETAPAGTQGS